MFEAYKGENLILSIATLDTDGSQKTNVSSATISIYFLDGSGQKQYTGGVTIANMVIQTGICSYSWITPLEPIENDWLVEFRLLDSNNNSVVYTDTIKILDLYVTSSGTSGGLTTTERDWLFSAYTKTANLSYDSLNNIKANIQYVKNDSVSGISDFKTDLSNLTSLASATLLLSNVLLEYASSTLTLASATYLAIGGVAQQSTLTSVLTLASATNIITNATLWLASATNAAVGSNVAQQSTLLSIYSIVSATGIISNSTLLLASSTSINTNIILGITSATNITANATLGLASATNLSVGSNVAQQSTLTSVLALASATNVAVGSNVAQQSTLTSVLALTSATNLNVTTGNVNTATDLMLLKSIAAGKMFIDPNTGITTHYKIDNDAIEVTKFQLIDGDGLPTNLIGYSQGRNRL